MKEFDIKKVNISDVVFTPDLLSFSYTKKIMTRQEEIAELKRRIEALEKEETEQWDPEGGDWTIGYGNVELDYSSSECTRIFGLERNNQQQAEKARDKMRMFNRLLAYHDEFCPDYEFETEIFIYLMLPHSASVELCRKINSGEVVL